MDSKYVLEMQDVSKEYFGNQVLSGVSLKLKPGEIHALMGENGAGKSTLMNILFGMPVIHSTGGFQGVVKMNGEEISIENPQKAMELGIGMVHQEFMLIPGFSVAENIKLGREITKKNTFSKFFGKSLESLDTKAMKSDSKKALKTIGLDLSEDTKVKGLPVGYMQFIEIAREIDKENMQVLIFDEPTAVLAESEAEKLLETMRVISQKGIAIIFITHRLDEVIQVTDSMTILRDGKMITNLQTKDTTAMKIAELMVGREIDNLLDVKEDHRTISSEVAISLKDFKVDMPGEKVRGVDIEIKKGEIFGIGGLAGQGKLGIPNGIMGLYPATGEVTVFGETLDLNELGSALKKGIGFVSEDRRGVGLLLEESIEQNIVFSAMQVNNGFLRNIGIGKIYDGKKGKEHAQKMVEMLDVRCTGISQHVGRLSGGNQQKVCIARALSLNPKILMVSEPTRGIDIGAKKLIIDLLEKLSKEEGITIIIVSSELVELRSICDRIAIISEGKTARIMKPTDSDAEFGLAMSGAKSGGASN